MKTFWSIMLILFAVMTVVSGIMLVDQIQTAADQRYCECLGHQPYINTKWHGRCLVNVLSYENIEMVETIFIAQEYCR